MNTNRGTSLNPSNKTFKKGIDNQSRKTKWKGMIVETCKYLNNHLKSAVGNISVGIRCGIGVFYYTKILMWGINHVESVTGMHVYEDPYDGELPTSSYSEMVICSVFEEMLLRGILLPALYMATLKVCKLFNFENKEKECYLASNFITTAAFGAVHLSNPNPSIAQVVHSSVAGFSYGKLYQTHELLPCIAAHITAETLSCKYLNNYLNGVVGNICVGIGFGVGNFYCIKILSWSINKVETVTGTRMNRDPYDGTIETCPYSEILFSSVLEEMMFRGILLPALYMATLKVCKLFNFENKEKECYLASNLITAAAFGLIHLINPKPSIFQAVHCSVVGFLYGKLYQTHGLLPCIAAHITMNTISFYTILSHYKTYAPKLRRRSST